MAGDEIRCFLAASLSTEVLRSLDELQRELRDRIGDAGPPLRWVPVENTHLTFKFFGDISGALVPAIQREVARVVAEEAPVPVEVEGVGAFPSLDRPRVLWAGVREPEEARLPPLHHRLEAALEELGLPRETRDFRPHLTLARVRPPRGKSDARPGSLAEHLRPLADRKLGGSVLRELTLFRSELRPGGARYTPLQKMLFRETD